MMTNKQKLDVALGALNKMKLIIQEMRDKNKTVFTGNRILNREYKDIIAKIDGAIEQLKHPTLSLATIGTTSSGKSTIVNALSGRTIAPMNSKEMSAGVLRLLPSDKISMDIKKSKNWECGLFAPITDADAYQKISNIFLRYHRFEKITTPPEITVTGPLLWSKHPEMIGLPNDVGLQFIDLPGLKTLTDSKNLEVIKGYVSNSVCIIAMDYMDVDETRINSLLEELKDIVDALDGNDSSILFLLNRVDLRQNTDGSLKERLNELTMRIKNTLPIKKEDVQVIPFISLMLYYAQSAIKDAHFRDKGIAGIDYRQIGELIYTYKNRFSENRDDKVVDSYNRVKACFKATYDDLDEYCGSEQIAIPETTDILTLIEASYRMSHADTFLSALKERIEKSFEYVIIYPAINNVFKAAEDFGSKVKTYVSIKRNDSNVKLLMDQISLLKERVKLIGCPFTTDEAGQKVSSDKEYDAYKSQLEEIRTILKQIPDKDIKASYKIVMLEEIDGLAKLIDSKPLGQIDRRLAEIESDTTSIVHKLLEIIQSGSNFGPIVDEYFKSIRQTNSAVKIYDEMILVPREIKEKLRIQIIKKVYEGLDKLSGTEATKEALRKNLSSQLVDPFLPSYTKTLELFKMWNSRCYSRTGGHYVITLSSKLTEQRFKEIQDIYITLNRRIRQLLSDRTSLMFELQSGRFVNTLKKFLKEETKSIIANVNLSLGKDSTSLQAYIENAFDNVNDIEIKLPENLFQFTTANFDPRTDLKREWVKTGTETRERGSCCPETYTVDVGEYRNRTEYVYDKFLDSSGLYTQWDNGVVQSEALFWVVLSQWIEDIVKEYMEKFSSISLQSVCEIDEMIQERLDEMRNNSSNTETKMKELEALVNQLLLTKRQISFRN